MGNLTPPKELLDALYDYAHSTCLSFDDYYVKGSPLEAIDREHRHIFHACINLMSYYSTSETGGFHLKLGKPEGYDTADIVVMVEK